MDELVVRIGPEDVTDLYVLIDENASDTNAEAMVLQLLREALDIRLHAKNDAQPVPADDVQKSAIATVMADNRVRRSTFAIVALAMAVLLLGGYAMKWGWTGFSGNNQLWDWMNLLVLPIAIATFPLWLRYSDHMSRVRKTFLGMTVLAFAAFVVVGYVVPLDWTGFQGNTLWDWLTLIVLPLAIVTASAWPTSKRQLHTVHLVAIGALALGWLVTLIGGYAGRWSWTGYPGNTLWDWMTLLLGPIAFTTILIPGAVRWLSGDVERHAAEEARHKGPAATTKAESSGGAKV